MTYLVFIALHRGIEGQAPHMDDWAPPGTALHFSGPAEHAGHAYRTAKAAGLEVVAADVDKTTGRFAAVLPTATPWEALVALVEAMTATACTGCVSDRLAAAIDVR